MTLFHCAQAGGLPGTWVLRGGWYRHGAVLGPARDGREREDRLSTGAGVGVSDDLAVGPSGGGPAGQATAAHRGLGSSGGGAGGVGPGDGGLPRPIGCEERTEILLERIARVPVNQLTMMKLLVDQTLRPGSASPTQVLGTVFDGIARHTEEGYALPAAGRRGRASGRRSARATSPSATGAPRPSKAERRQAGAAGPGR